MILKGLPPHCFIYDVSLLLVYGNMVGGAELRGSGTLALRRLVGV